MQAIIEKSTTDKLRSEHRACVAAIEYALSSLENSLQDEQDFRRRCQLEAPAYHANCPKLKWPIKLSNWHGPAGRTWRAWVRRCGLLDK